MSVNKVILIGNVGRDPEMRYYDGGMAVASFPLATTERGYTLTNGTQVPDRTDWHNIVLWRGQAQYAEKYIRKGDKLYVEGKIRTRQYDDQNGVRRYVTEIYGEVIELLAHPLGEGNANLPSQQSPQSSTAQAAQAAQAVQNLQAGKPAEPVAKPNDKPNEKPGEELPF